MSATTTETDELIPIADAIARHHLTRGKVSIDAAHYWRSRGCRTKDGGRAVLQSRRIGGRVFVTLAWLSEFLDRVAAADAAGVHMNGRGGRKT